jgi:TonB-dependent starch-binding outer membrane protein SusC
LGRIVLVQNSAGKYLRQLKPKLTIMPYCCRIRFTFLVLGLLLVSALASAQRQTVTGIVTDNDNKPLAKVTVLIKGDKQGTSTDALGHFTIAVPDLETAILVFSYVGFKDEVVGLRGQKVLQIAMKPGENNLGEVVVVGYGTQRKADLTGSVSTVSAASFNDRPITDASQALEGQAAGVFVSQTSGQPGGDAAGILIRGVATLGTTTPYILVDGIEGNLSNVNPDDIATITVLKDAASAAIYGSRAANGVILVTTKRGGKGGLHVDVNVYEGWQTATKLPGSITNSVQYMNLYNQALANNGQSPQFSQATITQYQNGEKGNDPSGAYPNNDWIHMIMKTATMTNYNVRLSGGNDNTQYAVSLNYRNQDGIVLNDNNKQYSLRVNLDSKVSRKFKWGMDMSMMRDEMKQSWYGGSQGMILELFRADPFYAAYTSNGQYGSTWVNAVNATFNNPYAMVKEGINSTAYDNLTGNIFGNYEIVKGLTWNVTGGVNYNPYFYKDFTPLIQVYNPLTLDPLSTMNNGNPASLTNTYYNSLELTFFSTLTYDRSFGQHAFKAMAGYEQETYADHTFSAYGSGFSSNTLSELSASTATPEVSGSGTNWALASYFGRLNYSFADKYLLEANIRDDGSSRFAANQRWGIFPSFSAGWNVKKEDFMKDVKFLSALKVRGSWGELGNQQIGLYGYIPIINLGQNYDFGNQIVGGTAQTALSNPNITWETSKKTDIGLDAGLLNNKLNVTLDGFHENRSNILQQVVIPSIVGNLTPPYVNLAAVTNHGWEASANYADQIGSFHFSIGFNMGYARNKVTYVTSTQINDVFLTQVGKPINSYYMLQATGIFKTKEQADSSAQYTGITAQPGDIRFADVNHDGHIDASDRTVVGNSIPQLTYGGSITLGYKGFDAAVFLQGVGKVYSFVSGELYWPFFNGANMGTQWLNAWTAQNPNAKYPRLLAYGANTANYTENSFWLQNAAYTRIKNLQIGYTLPVRWNKAMGINAARFYLNAQNPFTFTKFQGMDPERVLTQTRSNSYPNVRIITAGVNLKF